MLHEGMVLTISIFSAEAIFTGPKNMKKVDLLRKGNLTVLFLRLKECLMSARAEKYG